MIVGAANPVLILENIRQIKEPLDAFLMAEMQFKPIQNVNCSSGRPENN